MQNANMTSAGTAFPRSEVGNSEVADTLDLLLGFMARSPDQCKVPEKNIGLAALNMAHFIDRFAEPGSTAQDINRFTVALRAGLNHGYVVFEKDGWDFRLKTTKKAVVLAQAQKEVRAKNIAADPETPSLAVPGKTAF
jgi:hypothetical protein